MTVILPPKRGKGREQGLVLFAEALREIDTRTGFKVSSRGWCYQLENEGVITKGDFPRVQKLINECRKKGYLPIDFVADEAARQFQGVWNPSNLSYKEHILEMLNDAINPEGFYSPDYWAGEDYFIQVLVEKIDLVTVFEPICRKYHIPIATSRGWSSIRQRAEMMLRFQEMEEEGLKGVLLQAGDFDPIGLELAHSMNKQLTDLSGALNWSPDSIIIDRIGLNFDFIQSAGLSWINNLETGSGKQADLSNPIVDDYVRKYGKRKVEANAIVVNPDAGRQLIEDGIIKYLGDDALYRRQSRRRDTNSDIRGILEESGALTSLEKARGLIEEYEDE